MMGNVLKFLAGGIALVMLGVAILYIVRDLRDFEIPRSHIYPYRNSR